MRILYKKGFTLIELLVVISIISLLASVILTNLSNERAKARDIRRLAELKQMATLLILNSDPERTITGGGCAASDLPRKPISVCKTFDAGGTGGENGLAAFKDPSPSWSSTMPVCQGPSSGNESPVGTPCDYGLLRYTAVAPLPTTRNFNICAMLETGAGPRKGLGAGLVQIDGDGTIRIGCI